VNDQGVKLDFTFQNQSGHCMLENNVFLIPLTWVKERLVAA
jgi:hypothetical protein